MSPSAAQARLRLALVLWSGSIGGAETFVASLAAVLRASDVDARVLIVRRAGALAERLTSAGVPFAELGLDRGRAVLLQPRRFAIATQRAGADGAILAAGGFLPFALRLGGYRGGVVAVEHGSVLQTHSAYRRPRPVDRLDELLGAHSVDIHVAVSTFLLPHMPRTSRPVVTIPNGVNLDVYRPSSSLRSEAFVIGCMSRLILGKGVEDVLVAARPAILRGARLRIAGGGPLREELEELAERLGVRAGVTFEGLIRDASGVAAFWNGCDVAVTASNDWLESFGLVAVEAMACGRPVVATRQGGLAETVVHGQTGFLAQPRDTDALAAHLIAYMEDDSLVAQHGAAARARCEKEFDIRRCASQYATLVRGLRGRAVHAIRPQSEHQAEPGTPEMGSG